MILSPEQMQEIYRIQAGMFDKFRAVPTEGKIVDYLGKPFIVYPGVFWPHEDSKALVQNYKINPGEEVLDVCTGSGVIAIYSAWKGARKVVALDINPEAVRTARENVHRYGLDNVVEVRESDVFSALKPGEQFDVITMNSPFTDHAEVKKDYVEKTIWDQDLHVHRTFFQGLDKVLKQNGRVYLSQANFGAVNEMKVLAEQAGYSVQEIGRNVVDDIRTFYAFELRKNSDNCITFVPGGDLF